MLPATSRLKKDRDFQRVLQTGTKSLFGPLLVFTAPGETVTTRFGVAVSKKVSKWAVRRNKIRRQISELLRPLTETTTKPVDVVIVVLRSAEFADYQTALQRWQQKQ